MAKKHKKRCKCGGINHGHYGYTGMGPGAAMGGMPGAEGSFAAGYDPAGLQAGLGAAGIDAGLLQGMPAFLRSRTTEQFLLGALIGAAAAWVLSDEELRGKIVKSALKLYAGVAGGVEEMKEQMADIRAEVEAER
ncbi:hypothetical protein [Pseudothauera lacus]|uniref:hypothetical protein n=1 Tax=Pseudothauera lacus TaxID=2136175 RepID=UPI001F1D42CA|nr:hypothetical protein [Pseudothauera lacus]